MVKKRGFNNNDHYNNNGVIGGASNASSTPEKRRSDSQKKQRTEDYIRPEMRDIYDSRMHALHCHVLKRAEELKVQVEAEDPNDSYEERPMDFTDINNMMYHYKNYAKIYKQRYLRRPGGIMVFGMGDCGQLNFPIEDLSDGCITKPFVLKDIPQNMTLVASGGLHNVAVASNGDLYSWGCDDDGTLGTCGTSEDGLIKKVNRLTQILPSLDSEHRNIKIQSVAAGDVHNLVLTDTGKLFFFGAYKDKDGRHWRDVPPENWPLSSKEAETKLKAEIKQKNEDGDLVIYDPPPRGIQSFPAPVALMDKDAKVKAVACTFSSNVALLSNGEIRTWGFGECGELGRKVPATRVNGEYSIDDIRNYYLKPSPPTWEMGRAHKVDKIGCGGYHILVKTHEFRLFTCGLNNYGQLGLGDTKNRDTLTDVTAFDHEIISDMDGGEHYSLVLTQSGWMYAYGRADSGQLGTTDTQPAAGHFEDLPVKVLLPGDDEDSNRPKEENRVKEISCGGSHSLCLTEKGDVYTWGFGETSALGHGKDKDEFRPRKLNIDSNLEILQVCGGGQHSLLLYTEKK